MTIFDCRTLTKKDQLRMTTRPLTIPQAYFSQLASRNFMTIFCWVSKNKKVLQVTFFFKFWHLKFSCIKYNQFLYFRPKTFQRRQRSNDVSHPTVRQKTSEVDSPTIFENWDRSAMSSSLWSKFQFLNREFVYLIMFTTLTSLCLFQKRNYLPCGLSVMYGRGWLKQTK